MAGIAQHGVECGTPAGGATLTFGWAKNPLPANGQRGTWRRHAAEVRTARSTARALANLASANHVRDHGRLLRLQGAEIHLTWYVTTRRRRDADNLVPLMKPLVDGLVDAGVIPDDNDDIVLRHMPRIVLEPAGPARFELTIRPLERNQP